MFKPIVLVPLLLLLLGCQQTYEAMLLEKMQKLNEEIEALEASLDELSPLDQNGDGIPDSFYTFEGENSYESVDTNFDGEIDSSWVYKNGLLVSGIEDADYDGFWETRHFAKYGNYVLSYSDTDKNGIGDLYHQLENGYFVFSERYFIKDGAAYVGRVEYDSFGYPKGQETITPTQLTECEFQSMFVTANGL